MASRRSVVDRVERLGGAGLTAKAYRERVLGALRPVLAFDAHVWLLTDPVTRVGTSPLADAARLYLSEHTVHDHVKAVLAKGTAGRQALLWRIAGAA